MGSPFPTDGTSDDDREAVRAVLAGDTGRFTTLVERYRDRVFRFVLRHVGDRVAAEDLAQDAFLEAFRRLHTFRGESRFSTWLLGIALNLSRNYVNRDRPKQARHTSLDAVAERRDGAPDAAEAAERAVTLEVLRDAIARLGTELREALVLVAWEACSYEEAAGIIGVPVGTVKSRVFAARETLREAMQREGLGRGSR